MGIRGGVVCQNAYSSNLGRLLRLGGTRAAEPTEEKGDAEGEQAYHLGSGPSNFCLRCSRIGPTSLRLRPRSLTHHSAAAEPSAAIGSCPTAGTCTPPP